MNDPESESSPASTTGGIWRWEPPTPTELEKILPGYTIEKLVGSGGMGAVYKGIQSSLERSVAVKILPAGIDKEDPSFSLRFRNEAKLMARLLHPAIVVVFDFGQAADGQLYFVMEYVDGTDVHQLISNSGRLSPERTIDIICHVCDALTAAHSLGIVHRDIKPANILIDQQGQVKVADFGLAKIDERGKHQNTIVGPTFGTPDYCAPEILVDGVNVDHRADIYAVGVMLYQMLTGGVPRGVWKSPSVCVPGLSARFNDIVIKAMQRDPADRYQSSSELKQDLNRILNSPVAKINKPRIPSPPQRVALPKSPSAKPARRKKNVWYAAIGGVVLLSGGLLWAFLKSGTAEAPISRAAEIEQHQDDLPWTPIERAGIPSKPADTPLKTIRPSQPGTIQQSTGASNPTVDVAQPNEREAAFEGHRYLFVAGKLPWPEAKTKAEEMGGHLAVISSREEHEFAKKLLDVPLRNARATCWIGASQTTRDSPWQWVNGERMEFTAWEPKEPNRGAGDPAKELETYYVGYHKTLSDPNTPGWNDIPLSDGVWKDLIVGFLVEWDTPEGSSPVPLTGNPQPALAALPFAEGRKPGGKIRVWSNGPANISTDLGGVAAFDDLIQVASNDSGLAARRGNGEICRVAWGWNGKPDLGRLVGLEAFRATSMVREQNIVLLETPGGQVRKIFQGGSVTHAQRVPSAAAIVVSTNEHVVSLDADGHILASASWAMKPELQKPPPSDFFLGARAFTASAKCYISARPALPVRAWNVETGTLSEFPAEIRDIVEMDAAPFFVILRSASGKVFVRDPSGVISKATYLIPPANLPTAIAVRAGVHMCAAQSADGTWTAWGDSPALVEKVRKIGPAIDLDLQNDANAGGAILFWIEPLAVPSPSSEVAKRLAEIDAQHQAAYDREIVPVQAAAVAALDAKYLAAVQRFLDATTKAGQLQESVKLREESQRVTDHQALPDADEADLPDSLKKLRTTYRAALAKLELERDAKAKPLHARRDQLIGDFQSQLTQQQRLDEALQVKAVRVDPSRQLDRSSPDPVLTNSPSVAPPPAPASPQPASDSPSDGAATVTLARWVLKVGGNISVRVGEAVKFVDKPERIPAGPFEIVKLKLFAKENITNQEFAALSALKSLEELDLSTGLERLTSVTPLASLTNLRRLSIGGGFVRGHELAGLAPLARLDYLKITLKDQGGEGVGALASLPALRRLELFGTGSVSRRGGAEISSLHQLTDLTLKNLDRTSQMNLLAMASMPNLQHLKLDGVSPTVEYLGAVAAVPQLKSLSFVNPADLDPKAFAALKPAAGHLVSLYFGHGNRLNDEGVRVIAETLPNLETFRREWSGRTCSEKGLVYLSKLPRLSRLTWCNANDDHCGILADFPVLKYIGLNDSKDLTDKAFEHLKGLPKLSEVIFSGKIGVTIADVEAFRKVCPAVKVYLN